MNARVPGVEFPAHAMAQAVAALDSMLARVMRNWAPREPLRIDEWAERFRVLSSIEGALAGRYSLDMTPALRGILIAASDPTVRRIVVQKSAQVGYTVGVLCNVLGYHVHWKPSVQVVLFPRNQSAKDFDGEKFAPMVRETPALRELINLKSRAQGNSTLRKHSNDGQSLIKFVASNSPADVKSASAKIVAVEEPDDVSKDVRGQGSAIALVRERLKTYADSLMLIGGTPTAVGASIVVEELKTTDKRQFFVTCHACGDAHTPAWEHVTIPESEDPADKRDVYGLAQWEKAYYSCPHCGTIWTDDERHTNIRAAALMPPFYGWEPSAKSADPGFMLNELLSVFEGSRVPYLAKKYLEAKHQQDHGDNKDMIAFWNSVLGQPWEFRGELPQEDSLRERAEPYGEWCTPEGGLVATLSVDVQHDRLAYTVWTHGRAEEMWLSAWGDIHAGPGGNTIVPLQGPWVELERMMQQNTVRHPSGAALRLAAVGIDSGDGQTADAAYAFVRKHNRRERPVLALKGASDDTGRVEVWTRPKAIDPNRRATKASRAGVLVNLVGSARAKDILLGWDQTAGRVRLTGNGPGRLHWYIGVRDDFFEGLLSEVKLPSKMNHRVLAWTPRLDRRNEPLDCTVYALYLARHLRLHLKRAEEWDYIERQMRQASLLDLVAAADAGTAPAETPGDVGADAVPPADGGASAPVAAAVPLLPAPGLRPAIRPPARPATAGGAPSAPPAMRVNPNWSTRL